MSEMRAFAWHDLISLYRYRNQILTMDSATMLTHGNPLGPTAILTYLNPANDSFTGVAPDPDGGPALIGQIRYNPGSQSACLSYLLPEEACDSSKLPSLIEGLCRKAAEWGALQLLAEVDERDLAFKVLRRAGLSVYAHQRIWQYAPSTDIPGEVDPCKGQGAWDAITSLDEIPVRSLYHSLIPPLIQRAQPLPGLSPGGLVYRQDGEVLAYVESMVGPQGIFLQPLVHPAVDNVSSLIGNLPKCFEPLHNRPIYMVVRSYQAWLETALEKLKAKPGSKQALMVKHMTVIQWAAPAVMRIHGLDGTKIERSAAPVVQSYTYDN